MKKKLIFLVLIMSNLLALLAAQVKIGILKGTASIPFAYLYSQNTENYTFAVFENPEELFSQMQNGLIDATVVSSLAAEKLVQETNNAVTAAAVVSTSDFYVVGRNSGRVSFSSLVGKSVCIASKGLAYKMFLYLLEKNQIPVEEGQGGVNIVTVENQSQALSCLIESKTDFALLSGAALQEAFLRSKQFRKNINLQEQIQLLEGSEKIVPLQVLVVRSQFCKDHSKLFQQLKNDVETSVDEALRKPNTIAKIIEENNFGVSRKVCAKIILNSNFNFIPINDEFHLW